MIVANRAKETTQTVGSGTYTLDGPPVGFQSLVTACQKVTGDNTGPWYVEYLVSDTVDFEGGFGFVTDAGSDTLSRDVIVTSSNADAAVVWAAGTRNVVVMPHAASLNTHIRQVKNLLIIPTSGSENSQIDLTIDEIVLNDANDNSSVHRNVSLLGSATGMPAQLDTGTEAASTYHGWVISDGKTVDFLWSLSTTAPTMPAGYTFKERVTGVRNAASNFIHYSQQDDFVIFEEPFASDWSKSVPNTGAWTADDFIAVPAGSRRALVGDASDAGTGNVVYRPEGSASTTGRILPVSAVPTSGTQFWVSLNATRGLELMRATGGTGTVTIDCFGYIYQ